ncbi:hypothetical protein KQR54_18755 [Mycobacterium gordonae]|nr:hypothetical protein [Mycobacterium gordonae]
MAYEQARQSELILVAGPVAWGKIPVVTEFGYTHESDVTRRGQGSFGAHGPRGITEVYNGIAGTFSHDGPEGESAVDAITTMQDPADFVTGDVSNRYPFYIIANAYEEDGETPIRGHFVEYAKLNAAPRAVAGTSAMQRAFQAKYARDFAGKKVTVKAFAGASTPVTSLALSPNAFAYEAGKFALLVLRQTLTSKSVKVLQLTTDFTETNSAITLLTGLAATESAIVVYAED